MTGGRYLLTIGEGGAVGRVVILAQSPADAARQAAAILTLFPDHAGALAPIGAEPIAKEGDLTLE